MIPFNILGWLISHNSLFYYFITKDLQNTVHLQIILYHLPHHIMTQRHYICSPPWPLCYCHTFYLCKCYKPFNTLLLFLLSKVNYFKELFNNKEVFLYLYLPFLPPFVPLISVLYHSSPCGNSFNISGCAGLLIVNSFSFCMPGKAIFELSASYFLKTFLHGFDRFFFLHFKDFAPWSCVLLFLTFIFFHSLLLNM